MSGVRENYIRDLSTGERGWMVKAYVLEESSEPRIGRESHTSLGMYIKIRREGRGV